MLRVGDPINFFEINEDNGVRFRGNGSRTVRLTINAPYETRIYMRIKDIKGEDKDVFLAIIKGLEVVEFTAPGDFVLGADATIYVRSYDGEDVSMVYPDAKSFTVVTARRPRNPELERYQHMMQLNEERRMKTLYRELERERQRNDQTRKDLVAAANAKSASEKKPEPPKGSGQPVGDAPNSGEGSNDGSPPASKG